MNFANDSSKGAPGLRIIRQHLHLTQVEIGSLAGVTSEWARKIESGHAECSTAILSRLSDKLGCDRADFFSTPTPERLAEIEVAYRRKMLAEAESRLPTSPDAPDLRSGVGRSA